MNTRTRIDRCVTAANSSFKEQDYQDSAEWYADALNYINFSSNAQISKIEVFNIFENCVDSFFKVGDYTRAVRICEEYIQHNNKSNLAKKAEKLLVFARIGAK